MDLLVWFFLNSRYHWIWLNFFFFEELVFLWAFIRYLMTNGHFTSTSSLTLPTCLCDQIRSDQSLSLVQLFGTPWITACQASLSITNSRSSLTLTSIDSVMPSSHLILCHPRLLLPPISPSIRVFSSESTLRMRWPKYWSFSFSIIPSKEIPGLISFRMDWWTSSNGQHQNQIDYILCSQRWKSSIQSTKTRPGADCGSDHELLNAKFRLKLKKVGKNH